MIRSASLVIFFVLAFGACGQPVIDPNANDPNQSDRLVLAFYYPWYGRLDGPSARWYHWAPNGPLYASTNTPALGMYDSNDSTVVRQHIRWAKAAGIDGFISSWWGPRSFEERSLGTLLGVAEQENFRVTVIVESGFNADRLRADLQGLLATHAKRSIWLRKDGKPVLFIYDRLMNRFTPADFTRIFAGLGAFTIADGLDPVRAAPFDGVFSYGPVQDAAGYMRDLPAQQAAHEAAGRLLVAAVVPGYDDHVIRQPPRILPRENGAFYRSMWKAAAVADWVTVTSWNEWHEGTEIEPSVEYGYNYLHLTRTLADQWRRRR
jgi:glycoprotein endo-alpha-1,2-mannosidase